MTQDAFIKMIGDAAVKHYPQYKIFPSLTIAQAILESGWGSSRLSQECFNYFGMKWREGCGCDYKEYLTKEQRKDGWATSLKYSQNLKRVIAQHRLTSYDDRVLGKKDLETVARDVIDGKYGNGEDRKMRLRDAGYDPAEVQRIVNRMVM